MYNQPEENFLLQDPRNVLYTLLTTDLIMLSPVMSYHLGKQKACKRPRLSWHQHFWVLWRGQDPPQAHSVERKCQSLMVLLGLCMEVTYSSIAEVSIYISF